MPGVDHFMVVRPPSGEYVSGDGAVVREIEGGIFMGVIDVLGHGELAHELTREVEGFLQSNSCVDVVGSLNRLHEHMKGTRGAGVGLCSLDFESPVLRFAAAGNTSVRRFGSEETRLVAVDGVVGGSVFAPTEERVVLECGDVVVLHTKGVRRHFDVDDYPELMSHGPDAIARTIVGRFGVDHDDAACIALRFRS